MNKIKIFESTKAAVIENAVNEFGKNNIVFATQTHVTSMSNSDGAWALYVAVVFYKDSEPMNKTKIE